MPAHINRGEIVIGDQKAASVLKETEMRRALYKIPDRPAPRKRPGLDSGITIITLVVVILMLASSM